MTELAKDAIDKLDALLRSIAPGFVLLVSLIFVDTNQQLGVKGLFTGDSWNGFGLGALLGLVSYAIHLAILEDCWMRPVLWLVKRRYLSDIPEDLQNEELRKIIPLLSRERWARSVSENRKTAGMQMVLTKTYAWIIFLYCSGYLLLGGVVVLLRKGVGGDGIGVWIMMLGGILSLAAGWIADAKATRHEMWLIKRDPQTIAQGESRG
jgi:hypothetical protein